jgi:acyl-CoA reductase-like NAD-dependent aldehyde dehydrogenase
VLYRLAEMAESRREELTHHVTLAEGLKAKEARLSVSRAIDRVVWYAGWTDKIAQIFGSSNPVAGPYFNFSVPVPSGVVGVIAEQDSSLEAFVDAVLAPIAAGNTVVVVSSEQRPTPSILLGEMTATADFPAGLVNVITGVTGELAPTLAAHEDVDGLDLAGVDEAFADELALLAAGSIKRVLRPSEGDDASLRRLRAFLETSTVWHTIGQ